jgi:ABC-type branched-subunit amino acid transport system substrate-binding protein
MRKVTFVLLLLLAGVLAVSAQDDMLPLPTTHTECEVDLTGETITIYHFGDLSGPFAFITQPLVAGYTDGIAYFNEHGGVCGAQLAQHNEDTGGDLEQTQAIYDRFKGEFGDDMDLLVLYASADAELLREQLAEDGIVSIISAGSVAGLYGESGDEPGWLFATNPLYTDQLGAFCNYLEANADQYPDPVIGYISWAGAFGQAAFTPETIAYCAEHGVTIIDTPEIFLPTDTDITVQVQNLMDKGATILYTNTLASGPVLVAETVRALGLEGEVQLAGVNWVMDTSVGLLSSQRAGDQMPAVDGMLGSMPFYWWSEVDQPGIAFITQQAELNERTGATRNIAYLLSFAAVDQIVELYTQTVNRVGSLEEVTGADLKETLENFDYEGLVGNINYGEDGQLRAVNLNRIAMLRFLNADGTGVAESRDEAMVIPTDSGEVMVPVVVPLTDFEPAPDLRPGGADVPSS